MTRLILAAFTASLLSVPPGAARAEAGGPGAGRQSLPTMRIDVAFFRADIHNVLRFFAEVGRVNFVCSDDVEGTVTLQLKGVRWDQALRAILASKGLDLTQEGNIIRVARAEAFANERQGAIDARESCLRSSPLQTRIIRVSHAQAGTMAALAEATLQSPRGSVTVDERTNTLIIRDTHCPD